MATHRRHLFSGSIEDARTVTAAVLQALLPVRKAGGDVVLELPELGRIPLFELIVAVEKVKLP